MATYSVILALRIPWREKPGTLQSMGLQRSISKWGISTQDGEGDGTPLQYSCLENPMDEGAWWAAVRGVAQSWT